MEKKESKRKFCLKNCLIVFMIFFLICTWAFWKMGEQGRNARKAYISIEKRMTIEQVESIPVGRNYIYYGIKENGEMRSVSREEFYEYFSSQEEKEDRSGSMRVVFRGMSPACFGFSVLFDKEGRVAEKSEIKFWD